MPDDWRDVKLGELCTFRYGKMPIKSRVSNDKSLFPIYSGYRNAGYYDEYNIEKGELIVVARGVGGTGDVKLTPSRCYLTNLSIAIDVGEYAVLRSYLYNLYQMANLRYLDSGSAQSQITISDLQNTVIVLPDKDTLCKFGEVSDTIFTQIQANQVESACLAEMRDTLLPKLMSGELSVADI